MRFPPCMFLDLFLHQQATVGEKTRVWNLKVVSSYFQDVFDVYISYKIMCTGCKTFRVFSGLNCYF